MKRLVIAALLFMSAFLQNVTLVAGQRTVALYSIADNYADSKYPSSAYGRVPALYVGNSYDHAQDIWGSERIYIRFNLTELPKRRIIMQATLRLWQYYAPASEQTYEAHRVLADWNETAENWNNQPPWASAKTSDVVAPPRREVAVEWDITSDVKAWYGGEAENYGTVIKVANEGHVRDASSGFWSREYPVDEWKPRLVVVLRGDPAFTYTVTLSLTGLSGNATSTVSVDGEPYGSTSSDAEMEIALDRGTAHKIAVSKLVPGQAGVRYACDIDEIQVSSATSHVFKYAAEYLVTFSTEPTEMFQTAAPGWYRQGTIVPVNRTSPDVINTDPGTRLVFEAWYLNNQSLAAEPGTIVVDAPITLVARYRTEYYLNVTSPIGQTNGTGWHTKDTVAYFQVDTSTVPAEGLFGLLGLKRSFTHWAGSNNFLGPTTEPQSSLTMKEPTTVEAVWQDDYSSLALNTAIVVLVTALVGVAVTARKRRSRSTLARQRLVSLRRSSSTSTIES